MEELTHISEMGIHAHPSYSWDAPQSVRKEGAIEVCAEDSLVESHYNASLSKPVQGEEPLLEQARRRAS
jgi:hypothetical protein